jgi:hypothetical protein
MKKTVYALFLICLSCTSKPDKTNVQISLINNNSAVKLKGLDYGIISEINRDSVPGAWQSLIPVYKLPTDTDLKDYQPAQPGVYKIIDSAVVFTPDTPFINGKTYFMRYHKFDEGHSTMDYIKGSARLHNAHYRDLIFKQ